MLSSTSIIAASLLTNLSIASGLAFAGEVASPVLSPSSPAELVQMIRDTSPDKRTVIVLGAGEWDLRESLDIRTPVTLRGSGETTLALDTDDHYVPAIAITSSDVEIESLRIRHRSPSVANNYAVYVQNAGNVTLRGLDISSTTGTGVAIEGGHGTIKIVDCHIHDNKNNGIGLFPDVMDGFGDAGEDGAEGLKILVSGTAVDRNGKEAIIDRGLGPWVELQLSTSDGLIRGGVALKNCEAVMT